MFWKYAQLKVLLNIYFTWKISSLYFNFTPIIFNIVINNSYDYILELMLDLVTILCINTKIMKSSLNFGNYFLTDH